MLFVFLRVVLLMFSPSIQSVRLVARSPTLAGRYALTISSPSDISHMGMEDETYVDDWTLEGGLTLV